MNQPTQAGATAPRSFLDHYAQVNRLVAQAQRTEAHRLLTREVRRLAQGRQ